MWRVPATLLVVVTLLVDGTYQVHAAAFDDDDDGQVGSSITVHHLCLGQSSLQNLLISYLFGGVGTEC